MKIHLKSLNYATTATVWWIVFLTIVSEVAKSFNVFLTGVTGHHWISKGVFALVFFAVIYFFLAKLIDDAPQSSRRTYAVVGSVIAALLIIFLFFVAHFFKII